MTPADVAALDTSGGGGGAAAKAARPRGGGARGSTGASKQQPDTVVKVRAHMCARWPACCCSPQLLQSGVQLPNRTTPCLCSVQVGGLPPGITAPEVLGLFWGWAARPGATQILPAADGAPHAEVRARSRRAALASAAPWQSAAGG